MKIIITEEQLRQIIESENKKKLLSIPIELFYNKMDGILNNYREKGFNGIKSTFAYTSEIDCLCSSLVH
jgi:hypothetical protein